LLVFFSESNFFKKCEDLILCNTHSIVILEFAWPTEKKLNYRIIQCKSNYAESGTPFLFKISWKVVTTHKSAWILEKKQLHKDPCLG